jgi:hypothetical protein
MEKRYIIKIGNNTYYRYGGNTRDKNKATIYFDNEIYIAKNVMQQFKNVSLLEV